MNGPFFSGSYNCHNSFGVLTSYNSNRSHNQHTAHTRAMVWAVNQIKNSISLSPSHDDYIARAYLMVVELLTVSAAPTVLFLFNFVMIRCYSFVPSLLLFWSRMCAKCKFILRRYEVGCWIVVFLVCREELRWRICQYLRQCNCPIAIIPKSLDIIDNK